MLTGHLEGLVALGALTEQRSAQRARSVAMVSHFIAHGRKLQRFCFDVQPVPTQDRARFALARVRLAISYLNLIGEERSIRVGDLLRTSSPATLPAVVAPEQTESGQMYGRRPGGVIFQEPEVLGYRLNRIDTCIVFDGITIAFWKNERVAKSACLLHFTSTF